MLKLQQPIMSSGSGALTIFGVLTATQADHLIILSLIHDLLSQGMQWELKT